MIGVLAIIAIVASFVAPSLIRQVQTATAAGEDAKLDDIAQALTNAIKATGFIPNPNLDPAATNPAQGFGWAYLASNYTRLAGSNLVSVFGGMTNDTQRRLYLSTNLAGAAYNGGFSNTFSNWGATFFPTNTKMYLVSASRPDFALLLPTNGPNAQGANNTNAVTLVNALESWIKVVSNGVVEAPASLVDGWTNKGEFLHVRTVDLSPIFNEARAAQQKISDQEDKNLEEIARALIASIQANGQIPNPNASSTNTTDGWVFLASSFSSLGQEAFRYSFPLVSTNERRMYLDTNIAILPLRTPSGGWPVAPNVPASLFIVSSSKQDLDLSCLLNGVGANNSVTNSLNWLRGWSRSSSLPIINTIAPWTDRGEFLHVKTIDLKALFCRVELLDAAGPAEVNQTSTGSGYTNIPTPLNTNGTTVNFVTNDASQATISSIYPALRRSGLFGRGTNDDVPPTIQISGSSTPSTITITTPGAPQFIVGGGTNTMDVQSKNFYVLKGTSIGLVVPGISTNNQMIQKDCQFEYFGRAWRQTY